MSDTLSEIREIGMDLVKFGYIRELKLLLKEFETTSVSRLRPEQYPDFKRKIKQLSSRLTLSPKNKSQYLTAVELAHRFLRATDPDVDLTPENIADLIDLYALQQNAAAEGALEDSKAETAKVDHLLRLERIKVNVLAHALRFVAVRDFAKRVERMPAPSRLIVERAMGILKEEFPGTTLTMSDDETDARNVGGYNKFC